MEDNNLMNNPHLYGPGCCLSAQGVGFEPDLFLNQLNLPSDAILAYGNLVPAEELKRIAFLEGDPKDIVMFTATYLILKVSDSGVNTTQHKEAILFLKQYQNEILRLSKFPNVEQVNLRCLLAEDEAFEEHPYELAILGAQCGLTALM